jgi:hypothetical protein
MNGRARNTTKKITTRITDINSLPIHGQAEGGQAEGGQAENAQPKKKSNTRP